MRRDATRSFVLNQQSCRTRRKWRLLRRRTLPLHRSVLRRRRNEQHAHLRHRRHIRRRKRYTPTRHIARHHMRTRTRPVLPTGALRIRQIRRTRLAPERHLPRRPGAARLNALQHPARQLQQIACLRKHRRNPRNETESLHESEVYRPLQDSIASPHRPIVDETPKSAASESAIPDAYAGAASV